MSYPTTKITQNRTVLAKDNGDALNYGNRTFAQRKADAVRGEFPMARVSESSYFARGFYVRVDA